MRFCCIDFLDFYHMRTHPNYRFKYIVGPLRLIQLIKSADFFQLLLSSQFRSLQKCVVDTLMFLRHSDAAINIKCGTSDVLSF